MFEKTASWEFFSKSAITLDFRQVDILTYLVKRKCKFAV